MATVVSIVPIKRFNTAVTILASPKRYQARFVHNGQMYKTGWCKQQMTALLRADIKLAELIPRNLRQPGFYTHYMHDGQIKTA